MDLLAEHQLGPDDWDYMLVGDGSAQTVNKEAGAASFLIERRTGKLEPFYAALSHGDVATAELLAYLAPLRWLDRYLRDKRKEQDQVYKVVIVTDCKFAAQAGNGKCAAGEAAEFLLPLQLITRRGIQLKFLWVPRDQHTLNQAAHALANHVRRGNLRQTVLTGLEAWRDKLSQRENRGYSARSGTAQTQRKQKAARKTQREVTAQTQRKRLKRAVPTQTQREKLKEDG